MNHQQSQIRRPSKPFGSFAALALLAFSSIASAQTLQGNPYRPAGADYQIYASQGIDSSTPLGKSGFATQVNTDFEFKPSIGVAYEKGGKMVQFGLGLYKNETNITQSTGLTIKYDSLVTAYSGSVTVMDFDLKDGATGFNPAKVEPLLTIFGVNNSVIATFNPGQIFPSMVQHTDNKGKGNDIWDINFGTLLSKANIGDTMISGFQLSADMANGEVANSDPYLLLSVGKTQTVPEPASMACLGLGVLMLVRRKKSRK